MNCMDDLAVGPGFVAAGVAGKLACATTSAIGSAAEGWSAGGAVTAGSGAGIGAGVCMAGEGSDGAVFKTAASALATGICKRQWMSGAGGSDLGQASDRLSNTQPCKANTSKANSAKPRRRREGDG